MRPSFGDLILTARDSIGGALQHGLETSIGAGIWAHNTLNSDVLVNRATAAGLVGGAAVHGGWALARAVAAPHALRTRDASYHPHDVFQAGVWSLVSAVAGNAILNRTGHPNAWTSLDMSSAALIGTAVLLSATAACYGVALTHAAANADSERAPLIEQPRASGHQSPWLFKQLAFRLQPSAHAQGETTDLTHA